jgi:putative Mg2+ transporter-C (MgtC) family protein
MWDQLADVLIRSILAVLVGMLIGSERARHGREAGMRTHILVALGAAMTSMISVYAGQTLGNQGDMLRLSAQVISGVGFLGAGVIVFKNNNIITGLTTAAGVWTTSIIGIAVGCGYYVGAIVVTVIYMLSITLLGGFERRRKKSESAYVEIDDMYKANDIIDDIKSRSGVRIAYRVQSPKSGATGHLGLNLFFENHEEFNVYQLRKHEHIVFVEEE